jgi:dethiobiotin synthetase/adenosylmethionine--8-amino-7-oxononanoate aminotransferase
MDNFFTVRTVLMTFVGYRSNSAQELFNGLRLDNTESANFTAAPSGLPFGIHYRTLGDVAYFMLSLSTPTETIRDIEDKIWNVVQSA